MTRQGALAVALLGFVLLASPARGEDTSPSPDVTILAGTQVTLGTEGRGPVKPFARVAVDWNIAGTTHRTDAFAEADLTGLPDSQLSITKPSDFQAIEMVAGMNWRPTTKVHAALYCEAGFASRMETPDRKPAEAGPLWSACGVWFRERLGGHAGRLRIGVGPDERPGYGASLAATVKGSVKLIGVKGGGAHLTVRAVLGLERNPYGRRTNLIAVAVATGWGG